MGKSDFEMKARLRAIDALSKTVEPQTKKYLVTVEVEIHGSPMYPAATLQDAVRVVETAMGSLHANGYDAAWESFDYSITDWKKGD